MSGLLISWATPEASSPTAESFSAWTSWACVRLSSSSWRSVSEYEPRVVERDADLVGGGLDQRDLPLVERVADLAAERQRAEHAGPGRGWHAEEAAHAIALAPPTWRRAAGSATRATFFRFEGLAGGGHPADEPGADGEHAVDLAQPLGESAVAPQVQGARRLPRAGAGWRSRGR